MPKFPHTKTAFVPEQHASLLKHLARISCGYCVVWSFVKCWQKGKIHVLARALNAKRKVLSAYEKVDIFKEFYVGTIAKFLNQSYDSRDHNHLWHKQTSCANCIPIVTQRMRWKLKRYCKQVKVLQIVLFPLQWSKDMTFPSLLDRQKYSTPNRNHHINVTFLWGGSISQDEPCHFALQSEW